MIKGVIFDMDGLMIDSEKLYLRFWVEAGVSLGYDFKYEHALSIRSLAAKFAKEKFINYFNEDCYEKIRNKRIEMMDKYLESHKLEKKKGLDEILKFLKNKKIKMAVATATKEDKTRQYLSELNVLDYFDAVVSAHMVKNGKPKPDIYLEAASRLELNPKDCIALEDSPNGIRAAYEAGCIPIMIPDATMPDEDTKKLLFACEKDLTKVKKYID